MCRFVMICYYCMLGDTFELYFIVVLCCFIGIISCDVSLRCPGYDSWASKVIMINGLFCVSRVTPCIRPSIGLTSVASKVYMEL